MRYHSDVGNRQGTLDCLSLFFLPLRAFRNTRRPSAYGLPLKLCPTSSIQALKIYNTFAARATVHVEVILGILYWKLARFVIRATRISCTSISVGRQHCYTSAVYFGVGLHNHLSLQVASSQPSVHQVVLSYFVLYLRTVGGGCT